MENDLYKMKLHETQVANDGRNFVEALRVAGGWIYIIYDKSHNCLTSSFVPYNNEFQFTAEV